MSKNLLFIIYTRHPRNVYVFCGLNKSRNTFLFAEKTQGSIPSLKKSKKNLTIVWTAHTEAVQAAYSWLPAPKLPKETENSWCWTDFWSRPHDLPFSPFLRPPHSSRNFGHTHVYIKHCKKILKQGLVAPSDAWKWNYKKRGHQTLCYCLILNILVWWFMAPDCANCSAITQNFKRDPHMTECM